MIMEQEPLVLEEGMTGVLCVLDESGDSRTQWATTNPTLVEKAKMRFEELKDQGYLAYKISMTYGSGDGEVLTGFDPTAEKIICHRPLVGG